MSSARQPLYSDTSTSPFLGQLLASLYRNGLDRARITREAIEDDVHQLVEIKQVQDFDSLDQIYIWKVRGEDLPERKVKPKPPLGDPHRDMAAAMFSKPAADVTEDERKLAKQAAFGANYKADPFKVALDMICREGTWTHKTILGEETFHIVKAWKVRLLNVLVWALVFMAVAMSWLITRGN